MKVMHVIRDPYIEALKVMIRDRGMDKSLAKNLRLLGHHMGTHLVERRFLSHTKIVTPMGCHVKGAIPVVPKCVIISKRDERSYFASGLQEVLDGSERGFVDFAGKRGPDVYKETPREIALPILKEGTVHSVIVAKTAIAGGCTVAKMAHQAVEAYYPNQILIVAALYTLQGINEIREQFPKALFFVAGKPDSLNSNRMLIPGIGQLDKRLTRDG